MKDVHSGRVLEFDSSLGEARVVLGGVACRVCGGRGCAFKDRVLRVAVPDAFQPERGDVVLITGDGRAMVRAALRLLAAPLGAAYLVYRLTTLPLAVTAAVLVLGFTLYRGSRRADLPRVVDVTASAPSTSAQSTSG